MATIDEQFVEYIVKALVENEDDVSIQRSVDEKGVLLELTVHEDDLGRVIGKRGNTAQSIRSLLRALGTKHEARYNLKIVDVDGGRPSGPSDSSSSDSVGSSDRPVANDGQEMASDPAPEAVSEEMAPAPVEEIAMDVDNSTEVPVEEEESLADKTRKELEGLDDLDI